MCICTHRSEHLVAHAALCTGKKQEGNCVPMPLNLFALIPSNYTGTIAEHRAQEASSGGLDDRILHICVVKGFVTGV